MIAAVAFGPRRSGKLTDGASGAAYWAASVRHGPSWPLPADASAGIFPKPLAWIVCAVRLPRADSRLLAQPASYLGDEISRRSQGLCPLGRRRERLRVVPAREIHRVRRAQRR